MTITTATMRWDYSGTGSATEFPYSHWIEHKSWLSVILIDADGTETIQTVDIDYTVDGVGDNDGGNVVFASPPLSTQAVAILLSVPLTQEADYPPSGRFPAKVQEAALDKLTLQNLGQQEQLNRTPVMPSSYSGGQVRLPNPEGNRLIGWGSAGDGTMSNFVAMPTAAVTVSGYMETLLDDTDAATARDTLGVPDYVSGYVDDFFDDNVRLGQKGCRKGFAPRHKDADELYVGSGVVDIDGTVCELEAETVLDMDAALGSSFANSAWYCFGFKKPATGTTLTASELVCSQIVPAWRDSKCGRYLPAPQSLTMLSGGDSGANAKENVLIPAYNASWGSSQTGTSVSGAAYIGFDYGSGNTCAPTSVIITQSASAAYAIASAKLQYSDNGADWYDHETLTLTDPTTTYQFEEITLASPGDPHRYWRLLANENLGAGNSWFIIFLQFVCADTEWVRIINRFTTNGSAEIDAASAWDGDYYEHTIRTILNDTTPAYAAAEAISADVPAWGAPVMVEGYANLSYGTLGYSMTVSGGHSAGTKRMVIRVQDTTTPNDGNYRALTNSSGQIYHQGQNATYTQYLIYKTSDYLPSEM